MLRQVNLLDADDVDVRLLLFEALEQRLGQDEEVAPALRAAGDGVEGPRVSLVRTRGRDGAQRDLRRGTHVVDRQGREALVEPPVEADVKEALARREPALAGPPEDACRPALGGGVGGGRVSGARGQGKGGQGREGKGTHETGDGVKRNILPLRRASQLVSVQAKRNANIV